MMRVKVKICGLTNLEDALMAVDMGADMLGFNFYPQSPRYIGIAEALGILNKVPTFVDTVGIFVNPTIEDIRNGRVLRIPPVAEHPYHQGDPGQEPPRHRYSRGLFH
jgi:phosphoribosylanthranilate isomerase